VRGFSAVSMILIDEASRVPDELYRALRPMLAVGDGDLWMMSTPCGQRGFFYETWAGASGNGEEWMRVCVKATDCPRISASFLNRERGIMTAAEFAQEYMGEFHGDGTEYFDRQLVEEAVDLSIPELSLRGRN
jgi:hypothetical protein